MADLSVKMSLDSSNFEKGIQEIKQELQQFEQEAEKSGKAIGKIEVASNNGAKTLREYQKSIKNLKGELLQLDEGTEEYTRKLKELANQQFKLKDLNEIVAMSANDVGEKISNFANTASSAIGVVNGIQASLQMLGFAGDDVGKMIQKLQQLAVIGESLKHFDDFSRQIEGLRNQFPKLSQAVTTCFNVLKANPWIAIATAIASVVVYIATQTDKTKKLTVEQRKAVVQAQALKQANEAIANAQTEASASAGEMIGKYMLLKSKWEALGNSYSTKQQFINENASAFAELGEKISTVKEAEDFLINNTQEFVKAIRLRAQATAYEQELVKAYKDYEKEMTEIEQNATYVIPKIGDVIYNEEEISKGGLRNLASSESGYEEYVIETQEQADAIRYLRNFNACLEKATKEADAYTKHSAKINRFNEKLEEVATELGKNKFGNGDNDDNDVITSNLQSLIKDFVATKDRTAYNNEYSKTSTNEIGSQQYYSDLLSNLNAYKNSTSDVQLVTAINELIAVIKGEQTQFQGDVFKAEHKAPIDPLPQLNVNAQLVQNVKMAVENAEPKIDNEVYDNYKKTVENNYKGELKQIRNFGNQAQQIGGQFQSIFSSIAQCTDDATASWLNYVGSILGSVGQLINAIMAITAANSAQSASQTPIIGWMMVAGAIASTIAAFSAIPKFESGGIVGGTMYSGDRVIARVNSGEMILNKHQQTNLFKMLSDSSTAKQSNEIHLKVSGKDLVGVLNNYQNKLNKVK